MENATINKDGKGWKITFDTGKSLSIAWTQIPADWNGKLVEVVRENGQVTKISCEGKEISKQIKTEPKEIKTTNFGNNKRAFSPYNFIPLNTENEFVKGIPAAGFDQYYKDRFSGSIDLRITTQTPTFIRGEKENFLMINNKPVLPGSSIRGMIRTLVEIISYGKFVNYNDRKLYHRIPGINATSNRKLGFLNEENGIFVVYEAKNNEKRLSGTREFEYAFKKVGSTNMVEIYTGQMAKGNNFQIEYSTNEVKFQVSDKVIKSYEDDDTRKAGGEMEDLVDQLKKKDSFFRKRFESYSKINKISFIGIPVWYEEVKGQVIHFGHCKNYRVPYNFSIGDNTHIPKALQDPKVIDFAESIFGTTEHSGRVFFEDGLTEMNDIYETETALLPKILSGPKPTSYQHYLEQKGIPLKDWGNQDAKIRGYKLYWHRKTATEKDPYSWVDYEKNESDSHPYPIRPLKKGVEFVSKIRFENLAEAELGCLLFALQLPGGCCHKLGMGKPLGLGTVHIAPSLNIIDRTTRYAALLNINGSWKIGNGEMDGSDALVKYSIDDFKADFARHIAKFGLSKDYTKESKPIEKLWDTDRLKNLRTMLLFDPGKMQTENWLYETRYMSIDAKEFKGRPVLPDPVEVVNYAQISGNKKN